MPKSDHHSALSRQWEMLQLVPQRPPGITVRDLRMRLGEAGYPVTARTIERDLNSLSAHFGLCCDQDDSSRAQYWYFAVGEAPDLGSVNLVDAVSLSLAGDVLEKMLPGVLLEPVSGKIAKARSKLKALDKVGLARWSEKVRYVPGNQELLPPLVQRSIMDGVQTALLEKRQILVTYGAFQQTPGELRLHPLSLILRGSVPYLVARTFDYQDLRIYALHRMENVELLTDAAIEPPGYSVDAYLDSGAMQFSSGKDLRLKARLSEELAIYLSETPLAENQKIRYRGESWQLEATVKDSWQLEFWILSQSAGITVLSPKSLRDKIESQLTAAARNYEKT